MEKQSIVKHISTSLDDRIEGIIKAIKHTQDAANSESKSSAGDKYETGRAMAQNDRALLESQLLAAKRDLGVFSKINFDQDFNTGRLGCMLETSLGKFMLAISIGKVVLGGETIFVLSSDAPLGKLFMGKSEKDDIVFNGKKIKISKIY